MHRLAVVTQSLLREPFRIAGHEAGWYASEMTFQKSSSGTQQSVSYVGGVDSSPVKPAHTWASWIERTVKDD